MNARSERYSGVLGLNRAHEPDARQTRLTQMFGAAVVEESAKPMKRGRVS